MTTLGTFIYFYSTFNELIIEIYKFCLLLSMRVKRGNKRHARTSKRQVKVQFIKVRSIGKMCSVDLNEWRELLHLLPRCLGDSCHFYFLLAVRCCLLLFFNISDLCVVLVFY